MTGLLAALAAVGLLEAATRWLWQRRWVARGIDSRHGWPRVAVGLAFGAAFAAVHHSPAAAVAGAAAGWCAAVAVDTDLSCGKIPREPCWATLAVGSLAGATTTSPAGFAAASSALLLVGGVMVIIAVLSGGALGSGDIRLVAALTPLAWWTGLTAVLVGVIVAALLQAAVHAVLLAAGRGRRSLPFGPALSAGMLSTALIPWMSACGDFSVVVSC